jgi:hypothetical protein
MLPYAADPIVDPENDARDFHYRFKWGICRIDLLRC